ncbi:hypothetical protein Bbelb_081030 [Branchiostoma belcheri]|nr:hypothetical protein Bbelb_081030 [Branchiostoma belcheri]
MLKVGRLIRDSPVQWEAAYKVFLAASETTRPRAYLEFLEDSIPIPTVPQDGAAVCVLSIATVTTCRTYVFFARTFLGGYVCYVFSENVGKDWRLRTSLARHSHGCAKCKSVVCTPRLAVSGCVHRSLRKW